MVDTSDYLSYLTSFPHFDYTSFVALFLLCLLRLAPIVSMVPFLGSKLPGGVKMGLTVALAVILLPHLIATNTRLISFDTLFLGLALKEFLIGFILAFLATIPFYIAQSAGSLIDFLRGSSALMVTDPTVQTQVSPIGLLYNYVLIVIFFQIGGPFIFLEALLDSYTIIPADAYINATFFSSHHYFWQSMMHLLTLITTVFIQLAAPSLVAILMAEMFLGIANRLAPQVQIAFLGMSVKSLLGIALLWAGWFFILQQLSRQALSWLQEIQKLLHSLQIAH